MMLRNKIKSKNIGSDGLCIQMIKTVNPYAIFAITSFKNKLLTNRKYPIK